MNGNSNCIKEANVVAAVGVNKEKRKRRDGDGDAIVIQSEESGKLADSKEIKQVILDDAAPELNKKSKEKRKTKKISDASGEVEQVSVGLLEKSTDDVVCDLELNHSKKKHKEKKKKSKLESSETESKGNDNKTFEEDATVKEKSKSSKKRKRLDSEENDSLPVDKKEVEESNHKKTKSSEEQKESSKVAEVKSSLGNNEDASKHGKDHVGEVNANFEKESKSSLRKSAKEVNGSTEV